MREFSFAAAVALTAAAAFHSGAVAAEITVFSAAAIEHPFETVLHAFERDTGNKVAVFFGSVGAVQNKLKGGAQADLVVVTTALAATAEKEGRAHPGSRTAVGRAELGVAVRNGAAAPDVSTVDAFKKALLAARSVSFTDPAGGGTAAVFVAGMLDRLGVVDAIKDKSVRVNTGRDVIAALLNGDADIGIGFTSEFIPVKEVKVAGALPKEINLINEYSAYIPATSTAADSAKALLDYLARPAARDVFKAAGVGL